MFFYGTLRDAGLRDIVLGGSFDAIPAALPDHMVCDVPGESYPTICSAQGVAEGMLVTRLTDEALARVDFYEGGFDYATREVEVTTVEGPRRAQVYFPADPGQGEVPWSLADWQARWGLMSRIAAQEVMERYATPKAEDVHGLMPFIRNRAWSQTLAREAAPQTLRSGNRTDSDVEVQRYLPGFDGFFRFRPFEVRYRKFNGQWGDVLRRECFVAYDCALVLPYDPATDKVLLTEQLRFGPIHRGDPAPWVLEPVAGMVDAGETPEQAARREAVEEAGLELDRLVPVSSGYPSPGYSTEFYHNFIGLCDLSAREAQSMAGLETEHEDIRNHVLPLDTALGLIETGEINAVPLMMLLYATLARRDALRSEAQKK